MASNLMYIQASAFIMWYSTPLFNALPVNIARKAAGELIYVSVDTKSRPLPLMCFARVCRAAMHILTSSKHPFSVPYRMLYLQSTFIEVEIKSDDSLPLWPNNDGRYSLSEHNDCIKSSIVCWRLIE